MDNLESAASPSGSPPKSSVGGKYAVGLMIFFPLALAGSLFAWTASAMNFNIRYTPYREIPVVAQVPPFALTERSGQPFSSEVLKGHIWVANFIFTRCAGTCPTMSANMERVQSSISKITQIWPPILLVSFTVDPDWDTPAVLEKYADRYQAEENRWFFLSGKYDDIQKLARDGFKVGVQQGADSAEEPIIHSQSMVLVDARGQIRGYYDGTDPEGGRLLLADVSRVFRESR